MLFTHVDTTTPQTDHEPLASSIQEVYHPKFRPGHNLSLLTSMEDDRWNLDQNNTDKTANQNVNSVSQSQYAGGVSLRYTYDVTISGGFGFFIGSALGVFSGKGRLGDDGQLYPGYGLSFPSLLGGLVENLTFSWRMYTGAGYGADWFPKMSVVTVAGNSNELAPLMDVFTFFGGSDVFVMPHMAVTTEFGWKYRQTVCLNSCDHSIYFNSFKITSMTPYLQAGVTWSLPHVNER